jgi:hypothetical protein
VLRSRLCALIDVRLAASFCLLLPLPALAHEPKAEALAAFERYRALTEARMDTDRRSSRFLVIDGYPGERLKAIDAELRRGEFYLEQLRMLDGGKKIPAPGALIHHWVGVAFLPGATLPQTKAVLEDYEHQKKNYFPDVRESRLLSQEGDQRRVLLQYYSKTVVTAVFNVEFSSLSTDYSPTQAQIRACSTRVAEVDNYGTPQEHELRPADSHGYLWKLCTWWRIEERGGGTFIQIEAIELSRSVPFAFAWLVNPIIRNVPKTFLSHLLAATRKAVLQSPPGERGKSPGAAARVMPVRAIGRGPQPSVRACGALPGFPSWKQPPGAPGPGRSFFLPRRPGGTDRRA